MGNRHVVNKIISSLKNGDQVFLVGLSDTSKNLVLSRVLTGVRNELYNKIPVAPRYDIETGAGGCLTIPSVPVLRLTKEMLPVFYDVASDRGVSAIKFVLGSRLPALICVPTSEFLSKFDYPVTTIHMMEVSA